MANIEKHMARVAFKYAKDLRKMTFFRHQYITNASGYVSGIFPHSKMVWANTQTHVFFFFLPNYFPLGEAICFPPLTVFVAACIKSSTSTIAERSILGSTLHVFILFGFLIFSFSRNPKFA